MTASSWLPPGASVEVGPWAAGPGDWLVVTLAEGPTVAAGPIGSGIATEWLAVCAMAHESAREAALAPLRAQAEEARRRMTEHLAAADDARTKVRARAKGTR